ncbi:L,D-transpeptidase [Paenibacillus gorillae]|uniref:L,D-transpeptidase n=1 Tax=Paenibacillus gorillae TaxID=1243662 RepID=UPI0004B7A145|nr:L,D-transpeptidase [Paenibacillus gorillae]
MDTTDDTLYMKQYVSQHPDNKMAWYLLGKQYMLRGMDAKANYCFLQSGEIYDAYERKRHPLAEQPQEMLQHWNRRQHRKRLVRRVAGLAAIFLLFVLLMPSNGERVEKVSDDAIAMQPVEPPIGVVLVKQGDRRPIGSAWNGILAWPEQPKLALAVRLEEEDGWRKWTGTKRILMSVNRESGSSAMNVRMHDSAACNCQPADSSVAKTELDRWAQEQELRWTLSSAIYQYNRLYGGWPQKLEQLTRSYPYNVLSGDTPEMRAMFNTLLAAVKADREEKDSGKGQSEGTGQEQTAMFVPGTEAVHKQWRQPLQIVVDKATHRLAVVSGDIIVRSYPVGLGGDETPEGSFYISEKVRNPNGKKDGPFGNRGMTLSNTLYAIHGTDEPDSIGLDKSLGCIRMGKADVEELFDLVPLGTAVTIKNGTLPSKAAAPAERFKLEPQANESNPAKVYRWLN